MAFLDYPGLQHFKATENGQVAPVESGSTASQAYEVGEYFWHEGNFCKAKTAIASGASLVQNTNYTVIKVGDEIEKKANTDGYYEAMTVGNAEQLVSTIGIEDEIPYNYRTAGGSVDIGDRETDMVVGGTIAWNQLNNLSFSATNGTLSSSGGVFTYTATSVGSVDYSNTVNAGTIPSIPSEHKILLTVDVCPSATKVLTIFFLRSAGATANLSHGKMCTQGVWTNISKVFSVPVGTYGRAQLAFNITSETGGQVGDEEKFKNFMLIDLTQMFGQTIADYVYSLESSTSGAGVAWFRNLFPNPYYEYNKGTFMSVNTSSHNMTGFNQWDEQWEIGGLSGDDGSNLDNAANQDRIRSKNYIHVLPNMTYYFGYFGTYAPSVYICQYDAGKNFISRTWQNVNTTWTFDTNCYYIRFFIYDSSHAITTYNNDICVNLSWDGERDGEYEPYVQYAYPLDSSLELHGIPKLDSGNNLYYDGETYESDGTVTKKYTVIDLYSLGTNNIDSYTLYDQVLFRIQVPSIKTSGHEDDFISNKFVRTTTHKWTAMSSGEMRNYSWNSYNVEFYAAGITTKTEFLSWLNSNNVKLLYWSGETTEEAEPYQNPQIVDDFGTEEYVDFAESQGTRDVSVPVGHETVYAPNLRAKLETAPDSPPSDGDYIVRQTNGQNEYVQLVIPQELPNTPTTDGTYRLQAVVSSGTATLSWVSAT